MDRISWVVDGTTPVTTGAEAVPDALEPAIAEEDAREGGSVATVGRRATLRPIPLVGVAGDTSTTTTEPALAVAEAFPAVPSGPGERWMAIPVADGTTLASDPTGIAPAIMTGPEDG